FLAAESSRACASVLHDQNSTPFKPAAIMRLTALEPAPPTPITFMLALFSILGALSSFFSARSLVTTGELLFRFVLCCFVTNRITVLQDLLQDCKQRSVCHRFGMVERIPSICKLGKLVCL